ncbi:tetratricopeptide repeat protein [Gloeothece verrucosa]|uniref:TPR repeat-containing protein n=1 Tax=Gloeothece verrucosa (strain PCC 7822) TaxID=497965 RepID=E0UFC8_GLOV7|nr:tetratricopeptide repeat protein [Gloeothece verrucosa]ADN15499.1 TPR repeat-containing protein [Gloeothece verrucosa PCC 7822]
MDSPIDSSLKIYQSALEIVAQSKRSPSKEQVLDVLLARDSLKNALSNQEKIPHDLVFKIVELDSCLKKQAYKINRVLNLEGYRGSLPTQPEDWWWHLETTGDGHSGDNLDGLWKILRAILWTGNLSLLIAIIPRFLSAGAGLGGALGVVIPSLLTLVNARSEFTETGQKELEKWLVKWGIKPHCHEKIKLGLTFLVSLVLFLIWWQGLPFFAELSNKRGYEIYKNGQLATAEEKYLKAIAVDPDNLSAHYNLGNLYEDLQNFQEARKYYLIAAKGDIPEAYNNLGRLSIVEKKYPQAVFWLQQGIGIQGSKPLNVQYSLYKNLGWVRFEQKRYDKAEEALSTAIDLVETATKDEIAQIRNRGSASCLLGQILTQRPRAKQIALQQKQEQKILKQWQQCYELVSYTPAKERSLEEDDWLYLACNKLKEAHKSCESH